MVKIILLLILSSGLLFVSAQIYAPQGLNMPGSWNSWDNPPTVLALANNAQQPGGKLDTIIVGARRWHTTIHVASSGGDIIPESFIFLFTSGPSTNYYANKWGDVSVAMNSIQTYSFGGGNNNITVSDGKWYTVNWYDQGYINTSAIFMETSAEPVTIPSVSDNIQTAIANSNDATVSITLSNSKSTEEKIYVRYTNDAWSNWTVVEASGTGTSYSATIPYAKLTGGTPTNAYYVFSSTLDLTTIQSLSGTNIDLATINYNDNGGANYSLPVELTSFSAATIGSKVKLSWNTATEINNYGFEIERSALSAELQAWEKIGFVNGNGNSNSPKSYSFLDDKVTAGKYSYRLKQIDNDGQFEYSKTVEVNLNAPKKFELSQNYPNPFNPTTTISYNIPEASNVKLTIYNLLGQEIKTLVNEFKEAGVHTVNFNASELNSGLYIYKLQAGAFNQTRKMTLIK